jgi:hypothetical protein
LLPVNNGVPIWRARGTLFFLFAFALLWGPSTLATQANHSTLAQTVSPSPAATKIQTDTATVTIPAGTKITLTLDMNFPFHIPPNKGTEFWFILAKDVVVENYYVIPPGQIVRGFLSSSEAPVGKQSGIYEIKVTSVQTSNGTDIPVLSDNSSVGLVNVLYDSNGLIPNQEFGFTTANDTSVSTSLMGTVPTQSAGALAASPPTPTAILPPKISMLQYCPSLSSIPKLEAAANDAHAIASYDEERGLRQKVALAYYKCAEHVKPRLDAKAEYVRELATLLYASSLRQSLGDKPIDAALQQVADIANTLTASEYIDIQEGVAKLRNALPSPAPVEPSIDITACRAAGFSDIVAKWADALKSWGQAADASDAAGSNKATFLNNLMYSVDVGNERTLIGNLNAIQLDLQTAELAVEAAHASKTQTVTSEILNAVSSADTYAASYTAEGHRGLAGIQDLDHLKAARLSVDDARVRLRQVPYCEK